MRLQRMFNLNDPGWGRGNNNNDDSDPSRKPGNSGGPPDLDQVWRDFNKRLGSWFGKGPRRSGGGGGRPPVGMPHMPKGSPKLFVGLLIVVVLLWLASGFMI